MRDTAPRQGQRQETRRRYAVRRKRSSAYPADLAEIAARAGISVEEAREAILLSRLSPEDFRALRDGKRTIEQLQRKLRRKSQKHPVKASDRASSDAKPGHVRISPFDLCPSPENAKLYDPDSDADLEDFTQRIRTAGAILNPLIVTADHVIVSGHRRHAAAKRLGLETVPCQMLPQSRADYSDDEWIKLLREHNRSRSKTIGDLIREGAVDAEPEAAYRCLVESRVKRARNGHGVFAIVGETRRCAISEAKQPMLEAVRTVINARKDYWGMQDRQVHYCLLSDPPLRHSRKPRSTYCNDRASYHDLCDLLTRARVAGLIPWEAISDTTRPVKLWPTFANVGSYSESELSGIFGNYWRDLLQSQSDFYWIIIEKNSSLAVIESVGMKYTIPLTSSRGQCAKAQLWQIAQRFEASKKERLVLFTLSDFDPDGDAISNVNARSLRDDFGIAGSRIVPVRVALRPDQVVQYNLPRTLDAKETSRNYARFVERHGVTYACELEALKPEDLQAELDNAIRAHIDVDLFNAEVEKEKQEAGQLQAIKNRVLEFMRDGGGI